MSVGNFAAHLHVLSQREVVWVPLAAATWTSLEVVRDHINRDFTEWVEGIDHHNVFVHLNANVRVNEQRGSGNRIIGSAIMRVECYSGPFFEQNSDAKWVTKAKVGDWIIDRTHGFDFYKITNYRDTCRQTMTMRFNLELSS